MSDTPDNAAEWLAPVGKTYWVLEHDFPDGESFARWLEQRGHIVIFGNETLVNGFSPSRNEESRYLYARLKAEYRATRLRQTGVFKRIRRGV